MRLPIDAVIPEILERLREGSNLILQAPPGSGKTTRVPPALLDTFAGEILVLEPRRLAARLAARRVAAERGESVGQTVGFQVRFEDVSGPATRLRFLTEGVLTRRLLSDPDLRGVGVVVLDEFHERHLEGDLAMALLRGLQLSRRPHLRLVVMSATLDAEPLAKHMGGCPVVRAEGQRFELSIEYTPHSATPLEDLVASAAGRLLAELATGDILVFLPGAAEIRRAARACEGIAEKHKVLVLPLHGDLPPEEQDRAVSPAPQRKLILSTNVAESSITIEGVTAVIDSGLARVAGDSPWSQLPVVRVARISRASADQRAGRAGRTGPGRIIRLYTAEDYHRRPAHDVAEAHRRELAPVCLAAHGMGISDMTALPWFEQPPDGAVAAAEELLARLGAVDGSGLTPVGREMTRLPLHPRLARMVIEASARGVADDGCALAARIGAGERLRAPSADVLSLLDSEWPGQVRRVYDQIRRALRRGLASRHDDDALLLSLLTAFPDRVGRRRRGGQVLLSLGGGASLADGDNALGKTELLVALDVEERPDRGVPLIRLAARIEAEWLVELYPDRVKDQSTLEWNAAAERVEAVSKVLYHQLVIEERRSPPDPQQAAEMLAARALDAGLGRFVDLDQLNGFRARVAFAATPPGLKPLDEGSITAALRSLCEGVRSFAELEARTCDGGLLAALGNQVPPELRSRIEQLAPARIRLPNGRSVLVHYEAGKPPWIASRLQDFFGMRETPRIASGTVPVLVHLLAPNQRPVQMTTDLAGFWSRLYPQIRRELSRRYPKHAWPEDPLRVSAD